MVGASPDSMADRLAAVQVLSPQGDTVPMGSLWTEHPIVLALVRHFG